MERDSLELGPLGPPSCASASTVTDEGHALTLLRDGGQVTWHRRHRVSAVASKSCRKLQAVDYAPDIAKRLSPAQLTKGHAAHVPSVPGDIEDCRAYTRTRKMCKSSTYSLWLSMPIIIKLERCPGVTEHPRFIYLCAEFIRSSLLWNQTRSAINVPMC
ncbi:hypothetical protein BDW72DRAFT_115960 [Aspergillus terricola var. indicus]